MDLPVYKEGMGEKLIRIWKKANANKDRGPFSLRALSKLQGMPTELELEHWYQTSDHFKKLVDLMDNVRARRAFEEIDESAEALSKNSKEWFTRKQYIARQGNKGRFGEGDKDKIGTVGSNIQIVLNVDSSKKVDLKDVIESPEKVEEARNFVEGDISED